jgi:fructose-bisphosphate aldolase class I
MEKKDFRAELKENAEKISRRGFGILAADESTGTIGKRFDAIKLENNEENRRAYRELLFTTPGFEKYISGVILFEETTKQSTKDGKKFMDLLKELGVLPGIKVDKGTAIIPGTNDETATLGLDDLAKRAKEFYDIGCRFAKWRAVLKISADGCPSDVAIQENAWGLARYAAICQANGLVPIVVPEVLNDGDHDIDTCLRASQKVFAAVVKALHDNHVCFEGMLLKPNMITPGSTNANRKNVSPQEIAEKTILALSRTLPAAVPGFMFLSGGQSEEEATLNLNAMNVTPNRVVPWSLSFSYGRALQHSCIKTWNGKPENVKAAQDVLTHRASSNSAAQLGKYQGGEGGAASESLHVKNYTY